MLERVKSLSIFEATQIFPSSSDCDVYFSSNDHQSGTFKSPGYKSNICPLSSDCDVYFSSNDLQSGTFKSPGYESDVPRNTECSYHFSLKKYEKVKVTFVKFKISGDMPK